MFPSGYFLFLEATQKIMFALHILSTVSSLQKRMMHTSNLLRAAIHFTLGNLIHTEMESPLNGTILFTLHYLNFTTSICSCRVCLFPRYFCLSLLTLSCASVIGAFASFKSTFTLSTHFNFDLPLSLVPSTTNSITRCVM